MSKVAVTVDKLDNLANSIGNKFDESTPLTLDEQKTIIDNISKRTSSDVTASGATVTVPKGFYGSQVTKSVSSGSATPAATISATGASITAGTNTLTFSKTVSNTPQVSAGYISSGTAGNSSVSLTATVNTRSSSDLTASGATVTAPAGYYGSAATKSVDSMTLPTAASSTSSGTSKATISRSTSNQYINIPTGYNGTASYYTISAVADGTAGTPTASKGTVSNHQVSVTPSVTNITGYITGGTKTGTAVTVTASELASGNKEITSNGTGIDVVGYSTVSVSVGSTINNQNKSVTPTESQQTVEADTGYTGLGTVTVGAISSTYVGSSITRRSSSDMTFGFYGGSMPYIGAPAGYYAADGMKMITRGTEGTPTATKGTVSNHSISITPSVTNEEGYIIGGTKTGAAVTVTASELASGNKAITNNGTNIDVVGYSTVSVSVGSTINNQDKTVDPAVLTQYITADTGYTGLGTVTVNAMPTMTLPTTASSTSSGTKKADVSMSSSIQYINIPTGYNGSAAYYKIAAIANGVIGTPLRSITKVPLIGTPTSLQINLSNSDVQGSGFTAGYFNSVEMTTALTLEDKTVTPSTSSQTVTPTGNSYYLNSVTVNAMPTMTLPTAASSTSSGTSKATITPSSSAQYINIPTGYNGTASYYKINAASVSSTNTATVIGTSQDPDSTFVETLDGFFYQNGQTFTWTGDTYEISINSYGGTGGDIYVNGVYVATDEYYMSLPDCDVTITFINVGTNVDNIYIDYTPTSATCEMGIYVPTTDIATPTINFRNTHTDPPMYVAFENVSSSVYASDAETNTNMWWLFIKYAYVSPTEIGVASTSAQTHYGLVRYGYRGTTAGGSLTAGGTNLYWPNSETNAGSNTYPRYWATSTAFHPSSASSTRYWRAGHAFKWIAIWPPET